MYIVTECTGLLRMSTLIVGKIPTRAFMAGKARLFYVISKMKSKRFMWIGVAGKAVVQFKVRFAFVTHGTLWNGIFAPGKMLCMAIQTGNFCLVFAAVTGNCSGLVLVALRTISYIKSYQFCSCILLGKNKRYCCNKNNSTQFSK
jgi:hypothetical protein